MTLLSQSSHCNTSQCYLTQTVREEAVTFEGDKLCCGHPLVQDEGIGDLSVKDLSLLPEMCDLNQELQTTSLAQAFTRVIISY